MKAYKLNIILPEDKSQLEDISLILDEKIISMIGDDVNLRDYICDPIVNVFEVERLVQYIYLPKEVDIHDLIVGLSDFGLIESWVDITEGLKKDYTKFDGIIDNEFNEFYRITLLSNFFMKTLTVDNVLDYIKESGYESLNTYHISALKGWPLCNSIEELDSDDF